MDIHGGDIYRNHVKIDFSINVNPLGAPESVKSALHEAVALCSGYPDMQAGRLKKAVAKMLTVPEEYLLFGNGASELFLAAAHGIKAKKTVIPVPSFYGYEYAAKAADSEILYYEMKREDRFCLTEEIKAVLTEDTGLLFLANPNNPTGVLLDRTTVRALLQHCKDKGIYVVLDECFIEFCGNRFSMLSEIGEFDNLILVRTFTKIFSIPGVRLGYLISQDHSLLMQIAGQLPEWNLSCFAQEAGCICAEETEFVKRTENYIEKEREFLSAGLVRKGIRTFPSRTNYILIYSERSLYEDLLGKGLLIRDCRNFRGLGKGFYRIAVKSRKENEILLEAIGQAAGNRESKVVKRAKHSEIEYLLPEEIEKKSFEMIGEGLRQRGIRIPKEEEAITKRVIHTSADFDYAKTLCFSKGAVTTIKELIKTGADIVTDTNMTLAGINKKTLAQFGGQVHCFMAEEEIALIAKEKNTTRAAVSMEKAAEIKKPVIFAIGNAPTALIKLYEMSKEREWKPAFIIGVPVGFVNVEAAKELILQTDIPYIINRGRKGGSNIAAAICNAVLYQLR